MSDKNDNDTQQIIATLNDPATSRGFTLRRGLAPGDGLNVKINTGSVPVSIELQTTATCPVCGRRVHVVCGGGPVHIVCSEHLEG